MSRIALIDMDGTLCDYTGALIRDLRKIASPSEQSDYVDGIELWDLEKSNPHIKSRMDLIKAQPGWWEGLEPIPSGFEVVDMMRELEYDLHILTKGPALATRAWSEKVTWCQKHIPDAQIHVTQDKGIVYGRVLFDDFPPYAERWLKWRPRGTVIMPATSWNASFEHPSVVKWDGTKESRARVLEALSKAMLAV